MTRSTARSEDGGRLDQENGTETSGARYVRVPRKRGSVRRNKRIENHASRTIESVVSVHDAPGEHWIRRLLAWGSFSYACGFVLILIHTGGTYGLPVTELVKPLYVLGGLPIVAAIGCFGVVWRSTCRFVNKHHYEISENLRQMIWPLRANRQDTAKEFMEGFAELSVGMIKLAEKVPVAKRWLDKHAAEPGVSGWEAIQYEVRRLNHDRKRYVDEVVAQDSREFERSFLITYHLYVYPRLVGFGRATILLTCIALHVAALAAIPLPTYWYLRNFDEVPQFLGGPAPIDAIVTIETQSVYPLLQFAGKPAPSDGKDATITIPAKILFVGSDSFVLEYRSGLKIFVPRSSVRAVSLNKRDETTPKQTAP